MSLICSRYRVRCDGVIFADLDYAVKKATEELLWDMHIMVNAWYRKCLDNVSTAEEEWLGGGWGSSVETKKKKRPVEQRKVTKSYMDFINSSLQHYRIHIQNLASNYEGIPELAAVALKVSVKGDYSCDEQAVVCL